jgi:hypothetical protein
VKRIAPVIIGLLLFSVSNVPFLIEKVRAEEDSSCWTTLAPLPTSPTSIQGIAALDGKIYYIGGSTTMQYDPETNNWTDIAPLPISNVWGTVVACQNKCARAIFSSIFFNCSLPD